MVGESNKIIYSFKEISNNHEFLHKLNISYGLKNKDTTTIPN